MVSKLNFGKNFAAAQEGQVPELADNVEGKLMGRELSSREEIDVLLNGIKDAVNNRTPFNGVNTAAKITQVERVMPGGRAPSDIPADAKIGVSEHVPKDMFGVS